MVVWKLLTATVLVLGGAIGQHSDEALLRRGDIGAFAPESFRARLVLTSQPNKTRHEIEVWRAGSAKTLVRMLDPKDLGKFLLRLDDVMWFFASTAKKPVKLNASYRLYGGATLDEVLGVRLSNAYTIESTERRSELGDELVVFNLRARHPGQLFQQVRFVVSAATTRPVNATYYLRSGKEATAVEFLEWSTGSVLYAKRLVVKDLLRKGATTEIEIAEVEQRAVDDNLFSLEDGTARLALQSRQR
jgi:hypothetical protein